MSRVTRLRIGRALAVGVALWFRRLLPIHLVAALCLAPLALFHKGGNPVEDGTIVGIYGLHASAWVVSSDLLFMGRSGLLGSVTIAYLAQFAVMAILVREAHRRLAGRDGRNRFVALPGLLVYALGGLAAFVVLDLAITAGFRRASPISAFLGVFLASIAQTLLAGWFWLALPAAAVDGCGLFASLARSARLARGSRFRVGIQVILLLVLQNVAAILLGIVAAEPWVFALPGLLFLTLKACVLAATYRELCLLKEGPRPEEIGAIFA